MFELKALIKQKQTRSKESTKSISKNGTFTRNGMARSYSRLPSNNCSIFSMTYDLFFLAVDASVNKNMLAMMGVHMPALENGLQGMASVSNQENNSEVGYVGLNDEGIDGEQRDKDSIPLTAEKRGWLNPDQLNGFRKKWASFFKTYWSDYLTFFSKKELFPGATVVNATRELIHLERLELDWVEDVLRARVVFLFPEESVCTVGCWEIGSYHEQRAFLCALVSLGRIYPEVGENLLADERLWAWILTDVTVLDDLLRGHEIKVEQLLLASWIFVDWPAQSPELYRRFIGTFHEKLKLIIKVLLEVVNNFRIDIQERIFSKDIIEENSVFSNNLMPPAYRKDFLNSLCNRLIPALESLDLPSVDSDKAQKDHERPLFWIDSDPEEEEVRSFRNGFYVGQQDFKSGQLISQVFENNEELMDFKSRLCDQFKDPFETWLALAEKDNLAVPMPRLLDFSVNVLGSGIRINWTVIENHCATSLTVVLSCQKSALYQVVRIMSLRSKLGLTEVHMEQLSKAKKALESRYNPLEDDVMEMVEQLEEKLAVLEAKDLACEEAYKKERLEEKARLARQPIVLSKVSSILILCLSVVFGLGYLGMKLYGWMKNRPVQLSESVCFWRSNKKDMSGSEGSPSSKVDSSQFQNNEFGPAPCAGQVEVRYTFADSENQGMDAAIRMG